jgi:hypothetical protein
MMDNSLSSGPTRGRAGPARVTSWEQLMIASGWSKALNDRKSFEVSVMTGDLPVEKHILNLRARTDVVRD